MLDKLLAVGRVYSTSKGTSFVLSRNVATVGIVDRFECRCRMETGKSCQLVGKFLPGNQ